MLITSVVSAACISGNCTNGQGTYSWSSGEKYVGKWKDKKRSGQGTNTYSNGEKYVGEFKDDKKNGQGTYTHLSGEKYVGKWKDDKRSGEGTNTYPNGEKYVGKWKDGKRSGEGTNTYPDGRILKGLWKDDKIIQPYSDSTPIAQEAPIKQAIIGRRVALVVGNSHYQHTPVLLNPKNDASAIGYELKQLGFDTDVVFDVTKKELDSALRRFGNRIENSDTALFFYAGHGIQVDGKNYLIPIDARLEKKRDLKYETVALNGILEDMEGASKIRLVFLDACRDNPLSQTLARGMGNSRSIVGRGLARINNATTGTMISYATEGDATAADGVGAHSPYTKALLEHIKTPGLEVGLMLRRVRKSVLTLTNQKQVPWEYGSLLGEFYMKP